MNEATIVCPNCKKSFEISDAIQHQIDDELLKAKTEQSETLRKEYDVLAETKIEDAVQSAISEAKQATELQLAKERQTAKLELEKAKQTTELETELLRSQAESSKESEKQLREQTQYISVVDNQLTVLPRNSFTFIIFS